MTLLQSESVEIARFLMIMGSSTSEEKRCLVYPTCWVLVLLTVSLVVNVVLAAVGYVWIRGLRNDYVVMQNDMTDMQRHLSAASEMNHQINDMLSANAADREKRSGLSSTSSSRLAVDVGSVFVSTIKSMCKPEGAVCIPGAKGEAGQSGRDGIGLPGRDGRPGRDGEPGDDGLPGRDGLPGATGRDGSVGLRGPPGKPGAKGMGLPGKQGPIGIPGGKGERGGRGEKGVKGDIGGQGIQGVKGIQGDKGERGERGERGHTGYKGERGEKGTTGEKQMKGEKGEKGEKRPLELKLPSQCYKTNYFVLNETWRKASTPYKNHGYHCDHEDRNGFKPGWHVFDASIGTQIPDKCVPQERCGTAATGWLKGSHPTIVGQTRNETVCFNWRRNCCKWNVTVSITNCG